ncbi:sorting nexin 17 isoform X2 [Brevipalpus obovatus]|uniref:sorting nexin 17 isoform X2 n=1 Tax=Brevipalpus obovatus TaxID=246614 RepID=UPI003D9EAF3D
MHFSIPDTQELKEPRQGRSFGYSVYANGSFHCTLRYRQLHNFHEQLKKQFGYNSLPYFPPKKFWSLNQTQVEERRNFLEKYLQIISQDERINKSEFFNGFLLHAQQESHNVTKEEVDLDLYLVNWFKVRLKVYSTDKSSTIMNAACRYLELPGSTMSYFALFMVRKPENDSQAILERKMMDFESPYLTLKNFDRPSKSHFLVIRRYYWDPSYDSILMKNNVSLDLLYHQVINDVENEWIIAPSDVKTRLSSLKMNESKKEYIELARTLKYYGFVRFEPCICDYPVEETRVEVRAGGMELVLAPQSTKGESVEHNFRVTRIRCWRLTTCLDDNGNVGNPNDSSRVLKFELSFEYLFSKDSLKWITIKSDQSILMSVFLRSMVEELLLKRKGLKSSVNNDEQSKTSGLASEPWSFMKIDGTSHPSTQMPRSFSTDSFPKNEATSKMRKSFSQNGNFSKMKPFFENDAFNGIGDDDL